MRLEDIEFEDEAFKAAVLATGETEAEAVTSINGRRQKIKSARGLEHFPNLRFLDLTRNQLGSLDLCGNPKLKQLFVGNNQLEELDVSCCPELEGLEIFMNDIEVLDLSNNPKLEVLFANANDFSELDLSHNPMLVEVQLSDNQLERIEAAEWGDLESFLAEHNALSDEAKTSLLSSLNGAAVRL